MNGIIKNMALTVLIISLIASIISKLSIIIRSISIIVKQSKHNNTWLSTPKKTRIPGHANHVLKTPL